MGMLRKFKEYNLLEKGVASFGTLGGASIVPLGMYRAGTYPISSSNDLIGDILMYTAYGLGSLTLTAASIFIFGNAAIGLADNMKKSREEKEAKDRDRKWKNVILDARNDAIRRSVKPYGHFD